MPKNRIQFSDDFVLNNSKVGIGSSAPQEALDVNSIAKGENLRVTGVSSISGYEGFLRSNHTITENTNIPDGQGISGSLSGEIIVGTGLTVTGLSTTTSGQGQIDSLKVYNTFTVPVGGTLDRPSKAKPGQLFYNRDFATIEFYNGTVWKQVDNTTQRGRGIIGAGSPATTVVDFVTIATTGNAISFGNLTEARYGVGSCASSTRGIWAGGQVVNTIDYITIASIGNAQDFGDLSVARVYSGGLSSSTRGLFGGGATPTANNTIDYITIATIGNALDFGDLSAARRNHNGSCASPTRGVFLGGNVPGAYTSIIDFVTIASTGNAVNFGNSLFTGAYRTGCSNATRGLFGGGYAPSLINTIEYITISSTGNSVYFGDLTVLRHGTGACASQTRSLWGGGQNPTTTFNVIDYVNITSTGNAQDFGDLTVGRNYSGGCSDSHGGLGGF